MRFLLLYTPWAGILRKVPLSVLRNPFYFPLFHRAAKLNYVRFDFVAFCFLAFSLPGLLERMTACTTRSVWSPRLSIPFELSMASAWRCPSLMLSTVYFGVGWDLSLPLYLWKVGRLLETDDLFSSWGYFIFLEMFLCTRGRSFVELFSI